ncbi:alpha/beta fold hydrolase [Mycobacterium sp. 21AC1]|uniref:alpha/beta fold hydrolase n=1 Tax=[Mycobacterium] appelbergii TaxID=2939269 RepID=UPI002938FA14|nr:alpha/beta fold hydrolase [Mycobacterium sp. 21AC1]MDV3129163.1 alpha/beta fold hydrolase [Mycobacterium sp. 21AC1]
MDQYRRGDLVFDVVDAGPPDGPVVVLLHGFPQRNTSWDAVIARLTGQGFRCLAPNQRGYSPGARPMRRRDYRMSELVDDAVALIDASGAQRVHLVGHDWGAAVAWGVAATAPDRLASVSPLSVPHPGAFLRALATSRQGLASWYMYYYQLPVIPERRFLGPDGKGRSITKALLRSGQTPEVAERDTREMVRPGALTAALNWYRAMPLSDVRAAGQKVTVPTLYVWSDRDIALTAKPALATAKYVTGPYRFETLTGASHWLPDERPDVVADLLLEWFAAHPI